MIGHQCSYLQVNIPSLAAAILDAHIFAESKETHCHRIVSVSSYGTRIWNTTILIYGADNELLFMCATVIHIEQYLLLGMCDNLLIMYGEFHRGIQWFVRVCTRLQAACFL